MKKAIVFAAAAVLMSTNAMAERAGQEVYNTKCAVCHASGAANAPKLGDAAAWGPRAALGIDALMATAKSGKGAMPPKGLCMDCNDAELKGAIVYMLDNSK
ncbi:cytochrome c5 family protein [Pontibacterium sp. N1Y112]|uniref:Cytochrome c5 family protein n=1 Tax=Pontibacterium sinense TaxID=2781979 RepID=A0A8J7FAD4_9GAMM|nr:c-type cytochrome [Pontibacterium sinense]MBE9395889.1 cytochrome c5 family protein [Pontibacterium sinense]